MQPWTSASGRRATFLDYSYDPYSNLTKPFRLCQRYNTLEQSTPEMFIFIDKFSQIGVLFPWSPFGNWPEARKISQNFNVFVQSGPKFTYDDEFMDDFPWKNQAISFMI